MQDNFLAKISHEIRTPINAIIGLGYLFQQTRLEEQQRKYLTTIIDSAKSLLSVFQEMLDYSMMEDEELTLTELPFDIETVFASIIEQMQPRCDEKNIEISYEIDPQISGLLCGDSLRLMQSVLYLVDNAVKFTEQGSIKMVAKKAAGDLVNFTVVDTGIGVAEEFYEEIFKPFFQIDNSHTREYGGAGLGLATCSKLVRLMQGEIDIAPSATGGSAFSMLIPLSAAQDVVPIECSLNGRKALVVDQDALTAQASFGILQQYGMQVEIAASGGEEALNMIAAADNAGVPYDTALITWHMTDMDGIETAQNLLQMITQHPKPLLALQSRHDLSGIKSMARDAGFTGFLHKPLIPEEVLDVLEEMIAQGPVVVVEEKHNEVQIVEGPVRILLVEDNEINQEIACEVLKAAELDVDVANNGQEAVDAVAKERYSLVLMDVQMPIMDGLEATRCIRAAGHRMPIIAMTAHATEEDKELSKQVGMNAHLTKPLEPMALFSTINAWLPSSSNKKESAPKPTTVSQRKKKLPHTLEGFNLASGLATVGGNEALYISLLIKFADRYATINEDIATCMQKNEFDEAIRHAHTVRGIAANLGAASLASAAEALEKAFVHSPNMVTPHLRTLVVRLSEAVDSISEEFGSGSLADSSAQDEKVSDRLNQAEREHAIHVVHQAIIHVEHDWGHAVNTIQYFLERLQGTNAENLLSKLLQATEDFEVEVAQELLEEFEALLKDA